MKRNEIIIQFNSILYYLCAEPKAVRPITDSAQCRQKYLHTGQKQIYNTTHNNNKIKSFVYFILTQGLKTKYFKYE
jgi:hypothetical protein